MVRKSVVGLVLVGGILGATMGPSAVSSGAFAVGGQGAVPSVSVQAGSEAASERFSLEIDRIERCGVTCSEVTVSLTNRQRHAATNVVVRARIFAGTSGDPGTKLWDDTERIGSIAAGDAHRLTRRVGWGITDVRAVKSRDGWLTFAILVRSDAGAVTFEGHKQVA